MFGGAGRRSVGTAVAVAALVALLFDVLPAWLLSVTTIYGQAGDTSVASMAGFALAWFVAAGAAIWLARWHAALLVTVAGAVVGRLLLQWWAGPDAQTFASSLTLLALLGSLIVLAHQGIGRDALVLGLLSGVALSVTLRTALGGDPPMWHGALGGGVVVMLLVLLAGGVGLRASADGAEVAAVASGAWLALGPLLGVALLVSAAPLRAGLSSEPGHPWQRLVLVAATVLAIGAGTVTATLWWRVFAGIAFVVGVGLTVLPTVAVDGTDGMTPGWSVVPQAVSAVALGVLVGGASARSGACRTGVAAWCGLLLLFVGCLLFAATQATSLPFTPEQVVIALAVLGAALVIPGEARRTETARARWVLPVAGVVAVLVALPGVAHSLPRTAAAGRGFPVRVVSYNIHVGGVSLHGRYDIDAVADVIREQHPDVVWLSEVDRGWLVDGDHDGLPRLARELGMRYRYAPAAAADWGDAVLSRFPVTLIEQRRLPRAGAPTGAEAMAVDIDLGRGDHLGLVGTHLQTLDDNKTVPPQQAATVAAMGERLAGRGMPVVITGDLNAAPGSRALAALDKGFVDGLHRWRPVFTDPSDHPDQQLDQLYITPGLAVSKLSVPATTASDHRPLAVTVAMTRQ